MSAVVYPTGCWAAAFFLIDALVDCVLTNVDASGATGASTGKPGRNTTGSFVACVVRWGTRLDEATLPIGSAMGLRALETTIRSKGVDTKRPGPRTKPTRRAASSEFAPRTHTINGS